MQIKRVYEREREREREREEDISQSGLVGLFHSCPRMLLRVSCS